MEVRIPGKLIVYGEYGVLCPGFVGLGLPVNAALARVSGVESEFLTVDSDLAGDDPSSLPATICDIAVKAGLVRNAQSFAWKIRTAPLRNTQHLFSNAPENVSYKLGLGSSSAVAAGVARALLPSADDFLVARLAFLSHFIWQKNRGSGLDTAIQSSSRPVLFVSADTERLREIVDGGDMDGALDFLERHWRFRKFEIEPGGFLGLLPLRSSASTADQIDRFREALSSKSLRPWLSESVSLNARLQKAFGTRVAFGVFLDFLKEWDLLLSELDTAASLGIVTEEMGEIKARLRERGVFCKSTGAGGGDVMFVAHREDPRRLLEKLGLPCLLWPSGGR